MRARQVALVKKKNKNKKRKLAYTQFMVFFFKKKL
jgi:hypothetical protein